MIHKQTNKEKDVSFDGALLEANAIAAHILKPVTFLPIQNRALYSGQIYLFLPFVIVIVMVT